LEPAERELALARILAARERVLVRGRRLWVRAATPDDRLAAAEAYAEVLAEAYGRGVPPGTDVLAELVRRGLWDPKDDRVLEGLDKDVENLKVGLFKYAKKPRELASGRRLLAHARSERARLLARKHQLHHVTAEAAAAAARARVAVGRCLLAEDGRTPLLADVWAGDASLLDDAVRAYAAARPTEGRVRELARTEPWRGLWACRHSEGSVFGVPAALLTDDQRGLTVWSRVYDNAYEDPDRPDEAVFEDDDMFDGYLTTRRRGQKTGGRGSPVENEKVAEAGEVFVLNAAPAQETAGHSEASVAEVLAHNDAHAAAALRERMDHLRKHGAVHEAQMPDSKREIVRQLHARGVGRG
jgi:hypothetical protein